MCDSSPLSPFAGPRATSLFTSDYSSKFSPGTRKNGFSQCNLKSASFWNEAQRDINDGKSMKTMNFDNRMRQFVFSLPSSLKLDCSCDLCYRTPKLGVWGCNFQSRHCRNALSFLEMLRLHNLDGVGGNGSGVQFGRGNFGSSQGERDTLKFTCVMGSHEFGVIRPENDDFSHRLKQRSFRNELLGKSGHQSFQEPSSVYNSDCLEDKNGGLQFIRGTSEINQVTGNELDNKEGVFNVENSVLFDKVIADKKENGIEFGLVREKGEMENKKSSVREEMENPGNDSSLSDFDSLKLKIDLGRDKRTARTLQSLEEDDLVGNKGSQTGDLKIEGIEEPEERRGLRHGKQVLRRSSMLAKQVISMQSALSLGFVSQLWVDTRTWMVLLVEVRPSLLSGEMERFLLEDISQVGDVVLVPDETVLDNELKMIGLDSLVGYNVVTPGRRNIGKVRGYTFNVTSGTVELLELDSFGISIIPASLVSTYGLFVDDIIEVTSDTVIVHGDATTRLQRLTKGFWDARAMDNRRDELEEYPHLERRHGRSTHRQSHRRNFGNRKFPSKMRGTEDDFDLPMDY